MTAETLSLQGKVAVVTGSGRENGIGAGIALALARNGASVVIHHVSDSSKERAANVAETARKAGAKAIVVQSPVDTVEGARDLVKQTLEGFKTDKIDILVNNAGIGIESFVLKEPQPELMNKLFQTNVLGPFFVVNAAAPHMPRGGRIINVSSTAARGGTPQLSAYAASKAALDILTWNWAAELGGERGLTVNSVAPGPVLTDIMPKGREEEFIAHDLALTRAENRPGTIQDIGDAVLLLASEKSRWITGQYVGVSGGVTK